MNTTQWVKFSLAASLSLAAGSVLAQSTRTVPPSVPYVLDSSGRVVKSGSGLCVRTGYWSLEAARTVKLRGAEFPVGCECDRPLLSAEICEPPKPAPVAAAPAPAPAPVAPAPAPAPAPVNEKVTIPADALFEFDKAELTADGRRALDDFVNKLQTTQLELIVARGHADRIGSDNYNQKLSEKRAATVKDYLISRNVDANKVFAEGKGESEPKSQCSNLGRENGRNRRLVDCLAPDRRVELEAVGTRGTTGTGTGMGTGTGTGTGTTR